MAGFLLINVTFGALIYALFKRSGIIGSGGGGGVQKTTIAPKVPSIASRPASGVLDAELAD